MYQSAKQPKKLKIAYIGGGSRGWAWTLMDDLSKADDLCGEVALYDIDFAAAQANETIGALAGGGFTYRAYESPKEALTGADFVIISIMPGTFDEMESDVHTPEKYGIYQSVGDTVGRAASCAPCGRFPCTKRLRVIFAITARTLGSSTTPTQ